MLTTASTLTQNECHYPITSTSVYTKAGETIDKPAWISVPNDANKVTITATDVGSIGVYTVTITATINHINPSTTANWTNNYSFTLTVVDDCIPTTITDKTINNMAVRIALPATTQDIAFADSVGTAKTNLAYCGDRTYTLNPVHSFLSISGSTLSLSTSNLNDNGSY